MLHLPLFLIVLLQLSHGVSRVGATNWSDSASQGLAHCVTLAPDGWLRSVYQIDFRVIFKKPSG
jgi:hypothetical protein